MTRQCQRELRGDWGGLTNAMYNDTSFFGDTKTCLSARLGLIGMGCLMVRALVWNAFDSNLRHSDCRE